MSEKKNSEEPESFDTDTSFLSWPLRILWHISPRLVMKYFIEKGGVDFSKLERLHLLLQNTERIDLIPSSPEENGSRGFQLILDQKATLFFNQDGGHFHYDGFEIGEYHQDGDVTIFDRLPSQEV